MNNDRKHIAMRIVNQNRFSQSQGFRAAIFLVSGLFVIAAVPQARAQNWTRNQNLYCGHSPAGTSITRNYDRNTSCGTSVCPGQLVHFVHGIEASVNDSNSVKVTIVLPSSFTVIPNGIQVVNFPNGATTGTTSTPPTRGNLASGYSVGQLNCPSAGHADKVIILIDGYFTQAGAYSATFDITDTATTQPKSDRQVSVNGDSKCQNPQVDISIKKEVKDSAGNWGSSATWPFGSTVNYRLTVKNPLASDLYLGQLLTVNDTLSVPNTNGVDLGLTITPLPCTVATGTGTDCVSVPSASTATLRHNSTDYTTLTFSYPTTTNGFLPAGGSFVIPFNVLINTPSTCYTTKTYELDNVASIQYSNIADQNPANDRSNPPTTVVTLTNLPAAASTPCPPPTPIPAPSITKKLISPVTAPPTPTTNQPWGPFTYEIDITNNTGGTLTGLKLQDDLNGTGTPAFTADFLAGIDITCTPACTGPLPVANRPLVGSWPVLFYASFAALPDKNTQKVVYKVTYDAPCTEISPTPTTGGTITNRAVFIAGATGSDSVDVPMVAVPPCDFQVSKTQTAGPTSFASYTASGQTVKYHVQWKNNSNKTITVGSVVDAMSIDSALYGNVPTDYSYGGATAGSQCTVSNVTMPSGAHLSNAVTNFPIPYKLYSWSGIRAIDFSGAIFGPGGTIDCDISATLKQPDTKDSFCQGEVPGRAPPHFVNEAFMDLIPSNYSLGYYTSLGSYPAWHKEVITQLPYCLSISVGKTAPNNAYPGAPVTFTVTVTNQGKDPISNVAVSDVFPAALIGPFSWQCTTNCGNISPTSGSTNNISATINNLPAGATVTILVTATVPADTATGTSICNHVQASPTPFPANTYFEGDRPDLLEIGDACVQVIPSDITPTPTATATATATATITPTPAPATGCAQISGQPVCLPNGGYSYTLNITNNSGKPMSQILLTPAQGSTFTLTPQLTNLSSPLPSGQSTTVTTTIGNVKPGDKVCFFVSLMSDKAQCCIVQVCLTLPDCGQVSPTPTVTSSLSPTLRQQPPAVRPPPRGRRRP